MRSPGLYGPALVGAVITEVCFGVVQIAAREWAKLPGAGPEVVPNVHPARAHASYPKALAGRAGWHQVDTGCPIGPHTWEAALAGTEVAATVADMVLAGEKHAYALCRPPGHHAYADMAGGFCFLNNTAVAAQRLRSRHERVAILDVDVHHGNGTQGIFYERDDVHFASLHGDPLTDYPYYLGHADERGAGRGEGFNHNLPLSRGTDFPTWRAALKTALARIAEVKAGALVVSLGVDTFEGDPISGFTLASADYFAVGAALAGAGLPTVFTFEGGYAVDAVGTNAVNLLEGFLGAAKGQTTAAPPGGSFNILRRPTMPLSNLCPSFAAARLLPLAAAAALLSVSPAQADTGKLLLTGGVSSVEGAAGGGISPWAVIGSQATEGEVG
eukprot:gene43107-57350_t